MVARGKEAAALALHRFGFGPAGDLIAAIAADPRGALVADLDRPAAGSIPTNLPTSAVAARRVSDFRAEEQAKQKLAQRAKKEAEANGAAPGMSDTVVQAALAATPPGQKTPENKEPPLPQQLLLGEAKARFDAATGADIGLVERQDSGHGRPL
jgi:uncharacterized protein (DUF1800 family)